MLLTNSKKVIDIIENTLNYVDSRLIDHGKRVAYLVYKILKPLCKYDDKQLSDICILAILHDIGAYKTEEIDKMVIFETVDVWEHSIYGYLFLKYFSPLKKLSEVILFHHADCEEIKRLEDDELSLLAQLISLCDRADILSRHGGSNDHFLAHLTKNSDIKYRKDIVDMYIDSGVNIDTVFDGVDTRDAFNQAFRSVALSIDEVVGYLRMIVYSIDFRSSQTVIHTVGTVCIAGILAQMLGANHNKVEIVKTGAMLHDIGKMGIPLNILESPNRLNDAEMKIMRSHVEITEKILDGNVDDEIRDIAVRHHERLDGSGYPYRLDINDINLFEHVVAIADIFGALYGVRSYKDAYSKDKIITILSDMSKQNLLDSNIVAMTAEYFDLIADAIEKDAQPIKQAYNEMNEEYLRIMKNL